MAVFNEIFSKDEEWGMESGVVFDINVYALDFMHGTTDAGGQGLQAVGEGARVARLRVVSPLAPTLTQTLSGRTSWSSGPGHSQRFVTTQR